MLTSSPCDAINQPSLSEQTVCDDLQSVRDGILALQSRVARLHRPSFNPVLDLLAKVLSTLRESNGYGSSGVSSSLMEKLDLPIGDSGTVGDLISSMSAEELIARLTSDSSVVPLDDVVEGAPDLESGNYVFDGFAPLDAIISVISTLNTVNSIMERANDTLSLYNKESQDYLHALELLDLEQYQLEDVVCRLTIARRNRRVVQSFMSLCEPFSDFIQKNQPFLHGIIRTKAAMSKIKLGLDGRKYDTRVAKDLQPDFDALNNRVDASLTFDYPDE